ncbi:MAG: preprotein translocase subunit YajC [Clostridiales bacterium]|nr:preprotein translocase subunit YajC [Clostridiales bacterium]
MNQYMSIAWIAGLGALMYFMMIRPQRKQQKARTQMMSDLKRGDRVVTIGGIHGIIRAIRDDRVTLEISSEIYVQFSKNAIANVIRKSAEKEAKSQEAAGRPEDEILDADVIQDEDDGAYEIDQDPDDDLFDQDDHTNE